jgi:hypothetical protein
MPLKQIDYSKTIIYKIQHIERTDLLYVGHTTNFSSRKKQHKKSSRAETNALYSLIRANGGWERFNMAPIKQVECKNSIDALIQEQACIDELKATMNYNPAYKLTAKHDLQHYRQEFKNMQAKEEQEEQAKWNRIVKYELALLEHTSN